MVEIRLRRGLRARGHVVLPDGIAAPVVRVEVEQAGRRTVRTLERGATSFSVLLDPEHGESGSVAARLGPEDAPTHVGRIDVARFGEGEIVLTLAPVR
jgi:hypothetical protein